MEFVGTKFCIPRPTDDILLRAQLLAKLDKGLNCNLTLITAPSGYGKTTMVSRWILEKNMPIAWMTLEEEDNHWLLFWQHFTRAISKTGHILSEQDSQQLIHSEHEFIAKLLRSLSQVTEPLIIVFDDFHNIRDEKILKWLSFLLIQLPANVHLYIISRSQPNLRLAKLRITGKLNELTMSDFVFTEQEIAIYLKKNLLYSLSKDEIATISARTEGWITGIKLFMLIIQEGGEKSIALEEISGAHHHIATYFWEEILEPQPEKLKDFLMKTSLLCFLNKYICAAVTGTEEKEQLLQEIINKNIFIVPLEDKRKQYRYHVLFQEFLYTLLKEKMSLNQIAHMHLRAGQSLEFHNYDEESVNHYIFSGDFQKALSLLEKILPRFLEMEKTAVWKWTSQIPKEILLTKPKIYLLNLLSLLLAGKIEGHLLGEQDLLEKNLSEEDKGVLQSGLLYIKSLKGYLEKNITVAVSYSKKYIDMHPDGEYIIGFGVEQSRYHPVRKVFISNDDLLKSEKLLKNLLEIWSKTSNVYLYAHLCLDYGQLLYEWNRLEESEEYLLEAIKIGHRLKNVSLESIATLLFIKVQIAAHQTDQADYLLTELSTLVQHKGRKKLKDKVEFFHLQRRWKQGEIRLKSSNSLLTSLQEKADNSKVRIDASILRAELLIEEGNLAEADALLQHLLWIYRLEGQKGNIIKVLLSRSLLLTKQGKAIQSYYVLEEALDLSQKDRYIRTYLDFGEPMAALLNNYLTNRKKRTFSQRKKISIDYVKFLSHLFPFKNQVAVKDRYKQRKSILTSRELDVLELMGRGMSNKEVAFELDLSVSTIKTHINNIYRKLQVNSRLQAVQKADTLGILKF